MISQRHNCIFVHIPKCGGTSVEAILWPKPEDRSESNLWGGLMDRYRNKYQTGGLQHLFARHIRQEIGEEAFGRFFRFAFVRNPWDRVVSQYVYTQRRPDLLELLRLPRNPSLEQYLESVATVDHVQWAPQHCFLEGEDGLLLVDRIGRFENFETDLTAILSEFGVQVEYIPHEKKGSRGHYTDYFTQECVQRVAEMYQKDIEMFGYQFSPAGPASGA